MAADITFELCFHETIITCETSFFLGIIDPETDVSWNGGYKNSYDIGKQGEQEKEGGQYLKFVDQEGFLMRSL